MVYLFVLHRLAGKCTKIYNAAQSFKGPLSHPEVAFKFIDRKLICKQNILIKTFISGKMAPHIGCNGHQEITVVPPFCILARNTSDGEGSLG